MSVAQEPTSTGQETVSEPSASQPKRRRLLLIEDDPHARLTLWEKFKNAGFEIDLATNGQLAVEKLRATTPDAIFMDLLLPYVKGVDVIKEARRDKKFANRPIFVCTSAALMNVWTKRGTKAGASQVFDKGSTPVDDIVAHVARVVRKSPPVAQQTEQKEQKPKAQRQSTPDTQENAAQDGTSSLLLNPMKFLKRFARRKKDQPVELPIPTSSPPPPPVPATAAANAPAQAGNGEAQSAKPESKPQMFSAAPPPAVATSPGRLLVAVFTVDAAAKIATADASAGKMFGCAAADLVGCELKSLVNQESESEFAKVVKPGGDSANQLISVRVTARRKNGAEFPVSITRLAWSSDTVTITKVPGAHYNWTAVFRDLTSPGANTSFIAPTSSSPGLAARSKESKELAETQETLTVLRGANQALQKQLEAMAAKVAAANEAADKAAKHRDQLSARVEKVDAEAVRARVAVETQSKGRQSSDTQIRHLSTEKFELEQKLEEQRRSQQQTEQELAAAKASVARAEAERQQAAARAQGFQQEIDQLRQAHEALKSRSASESREQRDYLEGRLRETSSELQTARADREQRESDLAVKLSAVTATAQTADAQLEAKTEQCVRLEAEMATLQRLQQDLSDKSAAGQRALKESREHSAELERQLRETAAQLERVKSERARDEQSRSTAVSSLQVELDSARTAVEEANAHAQRLADEVAVLRQERDELDTRFASESESSAELKRRTRELEAQLQEATANLDSLKSERDERVRQKDADDSDLQEKLKRKETDLRESTAQAKRLEREVANLREERHELHAKCVAEKQGGTANKRRIKELEKQLREIASAFATTKLELEKRADHRGRLESELQAELEAAKAAQHEQTVRANLLERELGQVCEARDEFRAELEVEQHKLLVSSQRLEEIENRLRENAAELARAKAAAQHQVVINSPPASAANAGDLVRDLGRLRENEAAHAAEVSELERRVRDSVTSLARVTADLETERSERRRVEQRLATLTTQLEQMHLDLKQHLESERANQGRITELEQHLRERERMLIRFRADLQKETANRELAEQQVQAVGDMSAQLRQYLSLFEESKKVFQRTQDQLENKVKATHDALTAAEAKLQKEAAERQALEASLASAERNVNEDYEQKVLELARLQSELQLEQLERKRLEGDAQQSRFASLDSSRVARTMMNSLRRQLQDAIDGLMQATRRLLEISSEGEQKKLVQAVLENALMLQGSIEEGAPPSTGTGADSELRSAA